MEVLGKVLLAILLAMVCVAPLIPGMLMDMGEVETSSRDRDEFWIEDPDGVLRGIKKYIIGLESSLSDEIASNGGLPYAKFLMGRLIGYSTKEILIYQRDFPDKLMIEMIPDFQRFLHLGGKIRVLYLNFDGYDPDLFENKLQGDIKVAPIRYTESNNFNPAYYAGLSKKEKWNYLSQSLKFDLAQEQGFQIFDGRGFRVELFPSENLREFPSLYCFNKPHNAMMWVERFKEHFGSLA